MTTGHVKDWHAIYIFWRQPLVIFLFTSNSDHAMFLFWRARDCVRVILYL